MMKNYIFAGVFILSFIGFFTFISWQEDQSLTKTSKNNEKLAKAKKFDDDPIAKFEGPEKYISFHNEIRTKAGEKEPSYKRSYALRELKKAKNYLAKHKKNGVGRGSNDMVTAWTERGPANVPGRTRGLIVDPDDPNKETWFAGSAGGGVWKTEDAGATWRLLTPNIPNLATTVLGMAESNHDVIYMGTGEGFGGTGMIRGDGIFKSNDRGENWTQLTNTLDFAEINRLVVDPADENLVIVGSNRGIYRTTDGGDNWIQVYSNGAAQDIDADPSDFNTIYACINTLGVVKSTDKGLTWNDSSSGLAGFSRIEMAIAQNNTSIIYISAQGGLTNTSAGSGGASDLFVSRDAGLSWSLAFDNDGEEPDWVEGQGWYDNIIAVNPLNDNIVYAGGVELWKMEVNDTPGDVVKTAGGSQNGIEDFLSFVSFTSAKYWGGRLDGDLPLDEAVSIEVRFGPGLSQKAYRFTVDKQGAGVPVDGYIYQDYVDVPFQVWDIDNNKQLMVSFRDQQEDGSWNLIERDTDSDPANHSREYVFIHKVDYSETPDANIAQNGSTDLGHKYFSMYDFWPHLTSGGTWDPNNLPESQFKIEVIDIGSFGRSTIHMTDAQTPIIDGKNGNVHVDQHNIVTITNGNQFRLLVANDGGIFYTDYGTDPGVAEGTWSNPVIGYNNTQFYGVDKKPGVDEYFTGAQDNGTWYSLPGEVASSTTLYREAFGGDGFETAWNYHNSKKMIGASQNNGIRRSINGGQSWASATSGIDDDGPFVSRIASSKIDTELLFVVGSSGVWKSTNFGENWESRPINSNWGFNSTTDVEISLATPTVVWAGAGMNNGSKIHVSKDGGETFEETNNFDVLGRTSGIYSHPTDPATAFVLFSQSQSPKILKTTDYGQTWEDISGFAGNTVSDRGFPDVAVYSLLVMPHQTDVIWAGTEIGLFESLDGGASWVYLDSENKFPAVDVWDLKVVDDQVVIATYGRGIWSATIPDLPPPPTVPNLSPVLNEIWQPILTGKNISLEINLRSSYDLTEVYVDGVKASEISANSERVVKEVNLEVSEEKEYLVKVVSYEGAVTHETEEVAITVFDMSTEVDNYKNYFTSEVDDFIGNGFSVSTETGFGNNAIHSDHPYGNNQEFTYLLKVPIKVNGTNPIFSYKDVAIVEPGEPGTSFGDAQFWDYVVVEGSLDNRNWIPFADGYDANFNSLWTNRYNSNGSGNSGLLVEHEIDLTEKFNDQDVILIRLRLFADANTNGWGWAVDNFLVQVENEAPVANDDIFTTTLTGNVLINDTDPDEDDLLKASETLVSEPTNGTVTLRSNGQFTYVPNANFVDGTDTFEYLVYDSAEDSLTDIGMVTVTVTPLLGFEEDVEAKKLALEAYPNPAAEFTNVKYFLPNASEVSIQVFDLNGKMMKEFISGSKMNSGINEYKLNLNEFKKGLYIVQLSSDYGVVNTKIVVQ